MSAVRQGSEIDMPALTALNVTYSGSLYVTDHGVGTTLALPDLSSLGAVGGVLAIQAFSGGQVLLPQLAAITPVTHTQVSSTGTGSQLDLSSLTSFSGSSGYDSLTVNNGGRLL